MRYAKHLAHMFTSRVFRQLLGPVLAVMTIALAVGVYETLVGVSGWTGGGCRRLTCCCARQHARWPSASLRRRPDQPRLWHGCPLRRRARCRGTGRT